MHQALTLPYLPRNISPESDSASNMVIHALISLVVLVIVFCSALLGMLVSRILPQNHLTDQTKSVVTGSMGVVGTLTALVLGLLIAAAASSFYTKNQEVVLIAADVIRLDRQLRRYGPEAEGLRDLLRRYTAMKIQDLFPEGTTKLPSLENPRTVALLEELQDRVVAFDASNPNQRWLQSQALQLVSAIAGARWLLAEQNTIGIAVPLLVLVVFWLSLLFLSFGLFAPRNATAILALFLCALAVAGAIEMTQELNVPFRGIIRISSKPMKDALDEISLK
jgi:hypothetical protein